ncbi:ferredoxin-type protein NapF [Vibrio sp. S9_S30]|uniref:ferredoxin-type protein NapF n=1 Tax=Vibrio sp. S9_S30 TaxID=2720226 RepID=UPI0016812D11|nr:ferredoxin-type protein NapF [Vibrio sp. S9_S30]MBD1558738.1 ferredoxin-type protein NapF [Vibrio sp. S9_S30]
MVDQFRRRFFTRKQEAETQPRLPWLNNAIEFTDRCTRCNKCVNACETQIIKHGSGGFPIIDFGLGECTFCYQCADVCPEPLFLDQNEMAWPAKAVINDECLALKKVECRSCGDQCETMAIQFKLVVGKVAQPHLTLDECNGCGACVSVCPTSSINVSMQICDHTK